jgi:hypothetical protein
LPLFFSPCFIVRIFRNRYTLKLILEFAALIKLRVSEPELERPYRIGCGVFGCCVLFTPPVRVANTGHFNRKHAGNAPVFSGMWIRMAWRCQALLGIGLVLLAKPITLVAFTLMLLLGIAVYYTLKWWVWVDGGAMPAEATSASVGVGPTPPRDFGSRRGYAGVGLEEPLSSDDEGSELVKKRSSSAAVTSGRP